MILVIDASVTIAWIASDERSAYADAALAACANDRAAVPVLWQWEIANALLVLERNGRVADASAAYSSVIKNFPVDAVSDPTGSRGVEEINVARRHRLSIYDAAYLTLAKTSGLRLATLDVKLARAAEVEGLFFAG